MLGTDFTDAPEYRSHESMFNIVNDFRTLIGSVNNEGLKRELTTLVTKAMSTTYSEASGWNATAALKMKLSVELQANEDGEDRKEVENHVQKQMRKQQTDLFLTENAKDVQYIGHFFNSFHLRGFSIGVSTDMGRAWGYVSAFQKHSHKKVPSGYTTAKNCVKMYRHKHTMSQVSYEMHLNLQFQNDVYFLALSRKDYALLLISYLRRVVKWYSFSESISVHFK